MSRYSIALGKIPAVGMKMNVNYILPLIVGEKKIAPICVP